MPWVIDTCVLLDVAENDARFGEDSSNAIDSHRKEGCVVCPVSVVELAPQFNGNLEKVRQFLSGCGVESDSWLESDTEAAFAGWHRYIQAKRIGKSGKRPMADILIGAFASRRTGLISRNPSDFKKLFPQLRIAEP